MVRMPWESYWGMDSIMCRDCLLYTSILIISLLLLSTWMSAGAVDLNKENRDPKYVESIINRSQKIVDKLGLTDKQVAEDVRNIIANRYFELNDIYEIRDAKVKKVKESRCV